MKLKQDNIDSSYNLLNGHFKYNAKDFNFALDLKSKKGGGGKLPVHSTHVFVAMCSFKQFYFICCIILSLPVSLWSASAFLSCSLNEVVVRC